MEDYNERNEEEAFSVKVKAGKRTYFFDVKSTRSDDFYLTITESKRKLRGDRFFYEKHKIFLYKEDFAKFLAALNDSINFVSNELGEDFSTYTPEHDDAHSHGNKESSDFDQDEDSSELKWD